MKAYDIHGTEVHEGIPVDATPYPHITLGEGGHKRATWIALGKRDANSIVRPRRLPCPRRNESEFVHEAEVPTERQNPRLCDKCGERYSDWTQEGWTGATRYFARKHPEGGEVDGPLCVFDVGVIALKDGKCKYLIVAPPQRGGDNRVLVLWRVSSGYRGSATISPGEGVILIASDHSWHSGRGSLGETAEALAILKPGQELKASRSGRHLQDTHGRLSWDGQKISVVFGGEELFAATDEIVEGEYI